MAWISVVYRYRPNSRKDWLPVISPHMISPAHALMASDDDSWLLP